MKSLQERIGNANWPSIADALNEKGFAIIPRMLTDKDCRQLIDQYRDPSVYRKTVSMERYRFGKGEYKYYSYPLPDTIRQIRQHIYPFLAPIANGWMKVLNSNKTFPVSFDALQSLCHQQKQIHPTALILQYEPGGFNTLHRICMARCFSPCRQ